MSANMLKLLLPLSLLPARDHLGIATNAPALLQALFSLLSGIAA